ncbi:hypothetical protein K491DRAFT_687565 [Lophiostoma macrostomum CBS 122681]|uniref:Uncharacterized protein n=1 Tax=Lophiostoma macrostomum CBS 122681 TaxID=1314788 RepID=A0A6A6TPQ2_9PLEO|nr:hypothetical protein K491DRAFT_687565 [Lophiostoma macrostomum CBS 122681]
MATEPADTHAHLSASHDSTTPSAAEALSPLEQEVLDEYARLLGNLNNVSAVQWSGVEWSGVEWRLDGMAGMVYCTMLFGWTLTDWRGSEFTFPFSFPSPQPSPSPFPRPRPYPATS